MVPALTIGLLGTGWYSRMMRSSMIVTYKDDVSTLDPAIGHDWQNWSMIKSLFDGLMDYKPGTSELKKDLAEDYTISDGGKTFTFKLRKGVKFHNGREMTAEDLKYSLDRVTNPATRSPGAGFFGSIEGYDAVASGEADSLSGVTVIAPYIVEIKLSRPDATFLPVMAINFSSIVPKEVAEEYGADFGKHPVGTGAFKLADWTLGQSLTFERNADYWHEGLPKLDQITFEIGLEPIVALLRLQQGQADMPGDGIPPAKFLEVTQDEGFKDFVIEGGQLHTGYITMNVKMPPTRRCTSGPTIPTAWRRRFAATSPGCRRSPSPAPSASPRVRRGRIRWCLRAGWAAISTSATWRRAPRSTCRWRWRARCSRSATPMPRRAMARSAERRSKAR